MSSVQEHSDSLLVGSCAVVASVLARAIAPALPGTVAGIDGVIAGVDQLASFLTQFVVVLGVATAARLLLATLRQRLTVFRPVAVLACALVFPLVVSASSHRLAPIWLLAMVLASALVATASAAPALRSPASRVAGLVLCAAAMGTLVASAARILGLNASQQAQASLFKVARGLASVGMGLELVVLLVVGVWVSRRSRPSLWAVGAIVVVAAALAWAGLHGPTAVGWRVFVGRALSSMVTHPDPYFSAAFRYVVEVAAVLMAGLAFAQRGCRGLGAALGFALLARVSGDVPLCALMLILAALSAVRASRHSERTSPGDLSPAAA